MISYDTGDARFSFRAVAVIIQDHHILIHRAIEDDFWALPGGRVELFETSDYTVERELGEELGIKCSVVRQLWHVENFFQLNVKQYHEIANFYLVSLTEQFDIKPEVDFKGIEETVNLLFRWVPIEKLSHYNLKPEFLITQLGNIPNSIKHIKINDLYE